MNKINNLKKYKNQRKDLRNKMPQSEVILWSCLKNKKTGYKFRRQHGIDKYIIDFYCPELKLAIEVDGDSHYMSDEAMKKDKVREYFIKDKGIKIKRYTNLDVQNNIRGVIDDLLIICKGISETDLPFLPGGRQESPPNLGGEPPTSSSSLSSP